MKVSLHIALVFRAHLCSLVEPKPDQAKLSPGINSGSCCLARALVSPPNSSVLIRSVLV